jgi:two-component system, LytTR family, sensor kinase
MGPRPLRVSPRLIAGIAPALGIFSTVQAYNYVSIFGEREPSFPMLLLLNVTYWYAWAVLVPGMFWMARRFPFERGGWFRSALPHLPGVIVFVFLHAVIAISVRTPILRAFEVETSWSNSFQQLFFLNFDYSMMTYWGAIGVYHALHFYRQSKDQALNTAQLETRLAEASLKSLQRQLHPHFLFNTLHSISALMHRDPEAADEMLARLSDLLRLTLDRVGDQEIALKEEIDFLDKYLEIERARFGDRLRVAIDIEPDTLDALVPNFLLQPIVENAIRHGIARQVGGGRVGIRARREADQLCLSVRDTGPGIPDGQFTAVHAGVGISNTRSRLRHLFGERHRFEFAQPQGGGLAVRIAIPFRIEPDSNPETEENVA